MPDPCSMIERVARAIGSTSNYVISQHHAKALARAAIMAMREPTEGMVEVGEKADDPEPGADPFVTAPPRYVWRAMIDTALKEGEDA